MFFLNEKLIAGTLSIIAFFVSVATSWYYKVGMQVALLRGLICAFIFMFLGLLFGKIIKCLVIEAFVAEETKGGEKAAEDSEKKPEDTPERDVPRI